MKTRLLIAALLLSACGTREVVRNVTVTPTPTATPYKLSPREIDQPELAKKRQQQHQQQ